MIGTILTWIICTFGSFMILIMVAGELFGHANVRRFLFWVRGRSEQTGEPTRRFPLP